MKRDILDIKTVCECNKCLGTKTLHPQATLINLEHPDIKQESIIFEFYAILLVEDCNDLCKCCGRKYYDFSYASMIFLLPGEIFQMSKNDTLPGKGLLLAFHPDLLSQTSLNKHISDYTFFSYHRDEALHLSLREKGIILRCMDNIEDELHHAIDSHTGKLVSRLIELLLDYCSRFYERQFITRGEKNKALLRKLETVFNQAVQDGVLQNRPILNPLSCAERLKLSLAYFIDLLKFETGKTWDEYFQLERMKIAKKLLQNASCTPSQVACQLGYDMRQFETLFKRLTGMTPGEYCLAQN